MKAASGGRPRHLPYSAMPSAGPGYSYYIFNSFHQPYCVVIKETLETFLSIPSALNFLFFFFNFLALQFLSFPSI